MNPLGIFDKNELVGLFSLLQYTGKNTPDQKLRLKLIRLSHGSKFENPFTKKELKIMYDELFLIYHDRIPANKTLTKVIKMMEK